MILCFFYFGYYNMYLYGVILMVAYTKWWSLYAGFFKVNPCYQSKVALPFNCNKLSGASACRSPWNDMAFFD